LEDQIQKKLDENKNNIEKKMNENSAHMENNMDEYMYQMGKKMNEMKKSIESIFLKGSLKGIWRSKEILKIRRTMVLRLNHIWGVFYHN
jgi:hypothetical protein